jgi:sugar fermentation stimulation protein A
MLHNYGNTTIATCLHRPSKICKSPYVADISIENSEFLAHSPALGMDGYIATNKKVLVSPISNPKGSCKYSIYAAYDDKNEIYVGANPLHANKCFHQACKQGLLHEDFGEIQSIVPEYTHGNSRFDFFINDCVYVEVKSVLIERDNVAYFPVGNKKNGTISERANKHISELSELASNGQSCAIVFMVLREDVESFMPNSKDTLFCEALKNAEVNGVKVLVYQCEIHEDGIYYKGKLRKT